MKSKPPSKKSRIDPPPPTISLEGIPSSRNASNPSPSGSTSSNVSSLLSIPPPTSSSTPKASTATTASELVAAAKMAAASAKAQAATSTSSLGRTASAPSYPAYLHPELNEFSRVNMLLSMNKGGSGSENVQLPEGGLSMEDVDALQGELETLWSTLAVRMRSLKQDQTNLQNSTSSANVAAVLGEHYDPHHQEKINAVASLIDAGHGTRTSVSAAAKLVMGSQISGGSPAPSSATAAAVSSKKTAAGANRLDKLPKKKLKGEIGGASKKGSEKPARSTQNRSHSVSSDFGGLDGFYKHEAPNEFWEFADNYCGDVTAENIEELEAIINEHKIVPETLFDIPDLGKHFKEEEKPKGKDTRSSKRVGVDACGPLTQRLVSALVDERIAMHNSQRTHSVGSPRGEDGNLNQEQSFVHRAGLIKALGLDGGPNRPPMENQLRECLLDRGLLHPEDANDPLLFNPDDEILGEIKRTQNIYRKLRQLNAERLNDLRNTAQKELERAVLKKELDKADKEVIEAFKSIASMKLKKKPITKKEKDVAAKALEARERALKKLNPSMKSEPSDTNVVLKVEV